MLEEGLRGRSFTSGNRTLNYSTMKNKEISYQKNNNNNVVLQISPILSRFSTQLYQRDKRQYRFMKFNYDSLFKNRSDIKIMIYLVHQEFTEFIRFD